MILVVGFVWMIIPQVAIAQEQDQLMEMAKTLYQQPSKAFMEKTYQFMTSNANTSEKKKKVEELGAYVIYIDEAYKLIDIGKQKGKLEDEEKLSNAKTLFEDIDKYIKSKGNQLSEFHQLYYFNRDKNEIEKALQKKKLIRQFVPYIEYYSEIVIQYFAALVINGIEEQKTIANNEENIKKYYSAIDRMNGKGAIKVEKVARDYKGNMPFYEYYKLKLEGRGDKDRTLVSTFLDEKFVFDKDKRQEIISKLAEADNKDLMKEKIEFQMDSLRKAMGNPNNRKEMEKAVRMRKMIDSLTVLRGQYLNTDQDRAKAFSYKAYANDKRIDEFLKMEPTDTFGLYIDAKNGVQFINLRTGICYYPYVLDLNQLLESTTYLAKKPSIPDFIYDPSYSLEELFNYEWFNPEYPEKMCKALEGVEVYRTDINDYDVIKSVAVRRSNVWNDEPTKLYYDVVYQKGTSKYGVNPGEQAFSISWYERLKKCIGMKVIYCNNEEERLLYRDFIDVIPSWTLVSIELGNIEGRTKLIATIKKGNQTKRLDALSNCIFLTHDNLVLPPKDKSRYSHRLVPYEYVKKHGVNMPESEKAALTWFAKNYKESVIQTFREIWVGQKVSLFLTEFPNAKLVKNTVSGGKSVRIYHVNGNEFVFKDGVCTSVTKI